MSLFGLLAANLNTVSALLQPYYVLVRHGQKPSKPGPRYFEHGTTYFDWSIQGKVGIF